VSAIGQCVCLDLAKGVLLWKRSLPEEFNGKITTWGHCSSPLVADGKLIVSPMGPEAGIAALDPRTGATLWQTPGEGQPHASYIVGTFGEAVQIVGYDGPEIAGWDLATGRKLWRAKPKQPSDYNVGTPVNVDGKLLVATENNGARLYTFEKGGKIVPKPVATNEDLSPCIPTPVCAGGLIFGGASELMCLDAKTLKTLWTESDEEAVASFTMRIGGNGRLLVLSEEGDLLLVAAKAGKFELLGKMKVCGKTKSHPALADGKLYVRDAKALYCYDLRPAERPGGGVSPSSSSSASGSPVPAAPPTADIIQVLLAGKAGMPRDFDPSSLFSVGEFLYAVGPPRKPSIHYFKRDAASGLSAYAGSDAVAQPQCHWTMACPAGGRLYVLLVRWVNDGVDNRLVWYDVDAKTGKPEEKGITPKLTWTDRPGHTESAGWGRMLVPSVDQKSLYVATDRAILWFKIEADGRPVPAGQLAGKGIGEYVFAAPDGKWLYTMTHKPVPAIACIECKPNGELALGKIVDLDPKWGVRGVQTESSMSMTPDGKWLYAADWNPGLGDIVEEGDASATNSYLAIFQRDPATGALALADAGCGNDSTRPDLQLANSRCLSLLFSPDGGSGFISTASGSLLRSFARNAKTGRIGAIADLPEWDTRRLMTRFLWLDAEKGFLYGASGTPFGPGAYNVGGTTRAMWVARIGKGREAPRSATIPVLTGSPAASGPAAAADWPHWRGPSGDLRSPLRGIRKDWTGGLKKVWEIRGLSPGAHTWSAPAVQGNRLVVSGRHGYLDRFSCFDADRGGFPLWTAEIAGGEAGHFDWGSGSHAMAALDGDKLFVTNLLGIAACISMSDGRVLWKRKIGGGMYTCSPLLYEDLVILSGGNNYWHGYPLIAYRKDTGAVAWTYGKGLRCRSQSSPLLAKVKGRDQVVYLDQRQLVSLDPRTGSPIWIYSNSKMTEAGDDGPIPTPTVDGSIIYPAWSRCPTVQVEGASVKQLWTRFSKGAHKVTCGAGNVLSDAVVIDGYLYRFGGKVGFANNPSGGLFCAELSTGEVQWEESTGNGSLLVVDGCLLCLTYSGDLLLVKPDPSKFTKIAEIKGLVTRDLWIDRQAAKLNEPEAKRSYGDLDYAPCWAPLTVARGKLYIHYSDRLTCYDLMK